MTWDSDAQVQSVIGRPLEELLAVRPRRQALDGFESVYSDIVDYIVRCTHRIWDEKDVGLIRTHYSADCPLFTLSGKVIGSEAVVRNTLQSLAAFPDRSPIAEDVIWSEDAPGVFLSSHRIMSAAVHLGPDAVHGLPSGSRPASVPVIADCVCRENRIIEEWLVRDTTTLAWQLGIEPRQLAERLARADREGDPERHAWLKEEAARVRALRGREPPADHPAAAIASALRTALECDEFGRAAEIVSETVEILWPSGRRGIGRGAWIGCLMQLRAPLGAHFCAIDHWAARPRPDGDVAVAVRWWLIGQHVGDGVWGAPSGRQLTILAISHYRLRGNRVIEDFTVIDEVGVLRQVAGGLGACQS
jgi:SnoaL-like polyketide cyclase